MHEQWEQCIQRCHLTTVKRLPLYNIFSCYWMFGVNCTHYVYSDSFPLCITNNTTFSRFILSEAGRNKGKVNPYLIVLKIWARVQGLLVCMTLVNMYSDHRHIMETVRLVAGNPFSDVCLDVPFLLLHGTVF